MGGGVGKGVLRPHFRARREGLAGLRSREDPSVWCGGIGQGSRAAAQEALPRRMAVRSPGQGDHPSPSITHALLLEGV